MAKSLLVVGSFVQDLTWNTPHFPQPGATVIGQFSTGPGGKGSNQAVAACRSGAPTAFVGAVGRDAFAEAARLFHEQEGIQSLWVNGRGAPTGTAGILVDASGQNEIVVALGANAQLRSDDVPEDLLRNAAILICQLESDPDTVIALFQRARRLGVTTLLNPAPMRADFPAELLNLTDFLLPNETECLALLHQCTPTAAHRVSDAEAFNRLDSEALHTYCRELGPPTVVVTLGARGCLVSTADRHQFIPALKGIQVVDTTGAGDAFVGGFAHGLLRFQRDPFTAANYANTVAALAVTRSGTAGAMPHRDDIEQHWENTL